MGVRDEGIGLSGPVAEDLLREREDDGGIDIPGDDERGVVGHIVPVLDLPHLLGRHVADDVAVTDDVLSAPIPRIELLIHGLSQLEERARFLTVVLAEDDLFFSC